MKGSVRYYRDSVFKAEVDRQFELAAAASRRGVWITYAIHDPTERDYIEDRPQGLIRYVGQTKDYRKRVRKRMSTAGVAVKRPSHNIDGLLWDIMARGPAPQWSILEEVYTAIDSLVSETNWTIKLRTKGYPLVNQWTEHKLGTLEIDRYGVNPKRLWPITAGDALGSSVDVVIRDAASGQEKVVDLRTVPQNTRLQKIRAHAKAMGRRARFIIR